MLFFNFPSTRAPEHPKYSASKFAECPVYFENSCNEKIWFFRMKLNEFNITSENRVLFGKFQRQLPDNIFQLKLLASYNPFLNEWFNKIFNKKTKKKVYNIICRNYKVIIIKVNQIIYLLNLLMKLYLEKQNIRDDWEIVNLIELCLIINQFKSIFNHYMSNLAILLWFIIMRLGLPVVSHLIKYVLKIGMHG